jgi:hypothetical protein
VNRAALVAILLAGCTGGSDEVCRDPAPPDPPAIVSLGPLPDFVVPADVVISVAPYVDRNGDPFGSLEVAIWRGDERVWHAVTTDPAVHDFRLADGTFEGSAAVSATLEAWTVHRVGARYTTPIADGCESDGAWSTATFRTDDGSAAIFDPDVVHDFYLDLPQPSIDAINAEAYPPGCVVYRRNYYPGTVTYDGLVLDDVGVHAKGGCGSARNLDGKAGLKLNLSWDDPQVPGCPAKRRLLGLSRLTFNNMVQDPSMTHELLAYAFYRRMGVPVPRAALTRIHINGQYYGIYLDLETIDRRFLARHFASDRGMLYEGTYWCDLLAGNDRDDDTGCISRELEPDACSTPEPGDDPLDYTPIHALIATLDALPAGGFYPAIADTVDFDTLLSMWAVEAVLAHWDGYNYQLINNWRIYHDPSTGTWTFIPTGLDQSFQQVDLDAFSVYGRLGQRCLGEPACAAAFGARAREALAVFADMNMTGMRQGVSTELDTLLVPDPGREFDQGTYNQAQVDTQSFIDLRPGRLDQQLTAHGY